MKFVDEAKIEVWGGNGGNGCVSFRREKYVPRGGPNGGDGGHGGSVWLAGDTGATTLMDVRYKKLWQAGSGVNGKGKDMHGRDGKDLVIRVPLGTQAYDQESGEFLGEVLTAEERLCLARGGRGGRGNMHFVSATHQAPMHAEPGAAGEIRRVRLELKLLADVGLVGLPNAGKSTLISVISHAKPKIASYPFTTLAPQLGVVETSDHRSFTVADLPGLVAGAHLGVGLGEKFLKHIERTRLIVHLVSLDPWEAACAEERYDTINRELAEFQACDLTQKPVLVALTKADLATDEKATARAVKNFRRRGLEVFVVSSVTKKGLAELLRRVAELVVRE